MLLQLAQPPEGGSDINLLPTPRSVPQEINTQPSEFGPPQALKVNKPAISVAAETPMEPVSVPKMSRPNVSPANYLNETDNPLRGRKPIGSGVAE